MATEASFEEPTWEEELYRRFHADEPDIPLPEEEWSVSDPVIDFADILKKDLARRYIEEYSFHLLLCRNKKPVHRWQVGTLAKVDPASLPAERKARRQLFYEVHATDDLATICAMLDDWPDAEFAVDARRSNKFLIDLDAPEPARDAKDFPKNGNAAYSTFLEQAGLEHVPTLEDAGKKPGSRHLIYDRSDVPDESFWQLHGLGKYATGLAGLDIKNAGYVTLPSIDNGREWANELSPVPIPEELFRALDAFRKDDRDCRPKRKRARRQKSAGTPDVEAVRLQERLDEVLRSAKSSGSGDDLVQLSHLASLVAQLDPTDHRDYIDEWLRVGMAIHAETNGSTEALALWIAWSGADPKYSEEAADACSEAWDSLASDGGVGVGTLRHLVTEAGGEIPPPTAEEIAKDFEGLISPGSKTSRRMPEIKVAGRQQNAIADDVVEAVAGHWNDPALLFRYGSDVALVHADDEGTPALRRQTPQRFQSVACAAARYWKYLKTGDGFQKVDAKLANGDAGVALERLHVGDRLPALRGLIAHPIMRPDGSIVEASGYDPEARLYVHFDSIELDLSDEPSASDAGRAGRRLQELVTDFPFVDAASRANALALPITLALQEVIAGNRPLFAIDAPTAGTGKTLLVHSLVAPVIGRIVEAEPELRPGQEDELRKRVLALLREGAGAVLVDNIDGPLRSGVLAGLVTAPVYRDRVLGVSETAAVPNRSTWVVTGNNLDIRGDLVRRTLLVRMDAQMPQPEEREGFAHALPQWALEHRAELLSSVFTLGRRWIQQGRPEPRGLPQMGSFEGWRCVVGGALEAGGIEGFLGNQQEKQEQMAPEGAGWGDLLLALHESRGEVPVTVAEIVRLIELDPGFEATLPEELPDRREREFNRVLGNGLKRQKGRRMRVRDSEVWIEPAGKGSGGRVKWRVRKRSAG